MVRTRTQREILGGDNGFSCQNVCASLLDFPNAESEYRTVKISYVNLMGSFLTAASQPNFAVGREGIP